ncbi:MAG: FAD binding domain-containing protein [Phycisphaerales bacterium]|nr:FAD binding domain-containing protein [Phycisphaerales bacterium]
MNRFAVAQVESPDQAVELMESKRFVSPVYKAGGLDLLDHLKEGLIEPGLLVDIRTLAGCADPIHQAEDGTLRISANATLADIARSPLMHEHAPVIAQAAHSAASPQIRNVATIAGNLLQRPRCWYYRQQQFDCLKKGGHQCFAPDGENKYHAVFGGGPCHMIHPSSLAPALSVCNAHIHVTGSGRESIPITELFHAPDQGLRSEHNLSPVEIITHITFDPVPHSAFCAVHEKQAFDWPLAMAAAALVIESGTIRSARICAGAVAPIPWPLPKVEDALRDLRIDDDGELDKACSLAADRGEPLSQNAYKLKLLPVAIRRAVQRAIARNAEAPQ